MNRRELISSAGAFAVAQTGAAATSPPPTTLAQTGYVDVNGLHMYYETHGQGGTPLVLLHGAFSATGTSFGGLLPGLAAARRVISFELQGHGHTADIDRPMSLDAMAADVAAALDALDVPIADVFGYSMGGSVALRVALDHSSKVRKLVTLSTAFRRDGVHPGLLESFKDVPASAMHGTPWFEEYQRIAPRPGEFDKLWDKKNAMDRVTPDIPEARIRALTQPVLLIAGDSDLITLEHMTLFFRLLGGGVFGDLPAGLPRSQLAILPGVSHVSAPQQVDLLVPVVTRFLDR
jgi:pimeloyl-ACP methyl ester carboxylesterase